MLKLILTEKTADVYMRIALAANDAVRAMRILKKLVEEEPLTREELDVCERAGVVKGGRVTDRAVLYSISRRRNALRRWRKGEGEARCAYAYAHAYGENRSSGGLKGGAGNGNGDKPAILVFNLLKTKISSKGEEQKEKEKTKEEEEKKKENTKTKEKKKTKKELKTSSLKEKMLANERKGEEVMEKRFVESEEELKQNLKELELEEYEEIALYFFRLRKKRARLSKIVEEVMMVIDHPYGLKAFRQVKNLNGFKPVNYVLAVADKLQKNAEKARAKKALKPSVEEKARQIWLPADREEALKFINRMQESGIYDDELAEALRRRVEAK